MWQFFICAKGYFYNVHLNHGGLPHVPSLNVHLKIFGGRQVWGGNSKTLGSPDVVNPIEAKNQYPKARKAFLIINGPNLMSLK